MATTSDIKLASMAAGFTLGFGFLTAWEAIKQTRRNRNPLRSVYIYMLWGEIAANLAIAIVGWLFLDGVVGPTVPTLFFILFLWVFEVQLLLQIIVNRIAIIAEHRKTIRNIKWGTAIVITMINIAVFCIWIPSHMSPPVNQTFVRINNVWDRISKVLILIVDAGLNWYFLRTVKKRLLEQNGLTKYKPLVAFNAKLMVVSIAMDVMLIGLMSLQNQVVYIQFHPVAYMVKLNIEMSMAKLITRLAKRGAADDDYPSMSASNHVNNRMNGQSQSDRWAGGNGIQMTHQSKVVSGGSDENLPGRPDATESKSGIRRRMSIEVTVESSPKGQDPFIGWEEAGHRPKHVEDEMPLTKNTGHPKQTVIVEERQRQGSTSSKEY
ncbi:hypothetical protein S7711_04471 [Stachybotrys chartarum IBT 7711]|uniref:Satratoxin biosynthesis SC1 cluster protein 4 n=1 Tax=Stachybotrys chartarum (strain CBS 109288 / IBT 7711) TaxID=1280523 RepID=A0A084BA54_STACB|nr:hypothetical protein S7711_04471 [Stachybotrys chartarum IBT 7711]KFA54553.1 hypothetical protein S40293_08037 [Stachybotrys chartarum IBT 40293]